MWHKTELTNNLNAQIETCKDSNNTNIQKSKTKFNPKLTEIHDKVYNEVFLLDDSIITDIKNVISEKNI